MSKTQCTEQLQLFEVGRQQVRMTFDGGQIVSDVGLLPIRELDQKLGILAKAARRLPDPRTEKAATHTTEDILTQQVYQILAGYRRGHRSPSRTYAQQQQQPTHLLGHVQRNDVRERRLSRRNSLYRR